MQTLRLVPPVLAALCVLAGCSRNTAPENGEAGATPMPAQPGDASADASGGLPPGHPPIDQAQGGAGEIVPPGEGTGTGEASIAWTTPADWKAETPANRMRKAQYAVPGPGGVGECVVFYFGPGQGGDPKANAERWVSQFATADGQPVEGKTSTTSSNGLQLTIVEAKGTYTGSMGMGQGQEAPPTQPGYALLGAVVEGPDANWFFKFTGPEKTIAAQREAFLSMMKSVRKGA